MFAGPVKDGEVAAATETTPDLGMRLQEAVERLQDHGTMKMWPSYGLEFYQQEDFKKGLQESVLPEHLRAALPSASHEAVVHEALSALLEDVSGIRQRTENPKRTGAYPAETVATGAVEAEKQFRFLEGVKVLLDVAGEVVVCYQVASMVLVGPGTISEGKLPANCARKILALELHHSLEQRLC